MAALNFRTLTAANTIIILSAPPAWVGEQIQGFSTDDVYDVDEADVAETLIGVDGNMSAGFINFLTDFTITLQADSFSNDLFELLLSEQKAVSEVFYMSGIINLPGLSRTYNMTKGVLKRIQQAPSAGKLLKMRKYRMTWQSIDPQTA
jgi:hypothetical protein